MALRKHDGVIQRDQQRALDAYDAVHRVKDNQKEYKIAVNDLGANILRSGLSAALSALERQSGGQALLTHLADAGLPGLNGVGGKELPARVRKLELDDYILVTRESLKVAAWLKRASQATFGE